MQEFEKSVIVAHYLKIVDNIVILDKNKFENFKKCYSIKNAQKIDTLHKISFSKIARFSFKKNQHYNKIFKK